ncbi:hypothetical protein GGP66_000237 [Salinibacter ruber]|uniref:hypothetical protein n=1 Tax=Salinibacter ruber TaxID=146919 RepID=UPI00216876FF|nr:hypothetical protein [Salinibacter ruber]MCS3672833.1 hypothetical protein [Salinibacter ruber]
MNDDTVVRMSLEEAVRRYESGESSSDWERVDGLTDEEITQAVREDPDQEILDEEWFRRATLVIPGEKETT